jgi:predicted nuclease of restriction endonuclease-like (RecB) superfamily
MLLLKKPLPLHLQRTLRLQMHQANLKQSLPNLLVKNPRSKYRQSLSLQNLKPNRNLSQSRNQNAPKALPVVVGGTARLNRQKELCVTTTV